MTRIECKAIAVVLVRMNGKIAEVKEKTLSAIVLRNVVKKKVYFRQMQYNLLGQSP